MNLVKFLVYGAILSVTLGQFGHFPFGASSGINLTDLILILSLIFFLIWIVSTDFTLKIPKIFLIIMGFWGIALLSLLFSLTQFPPFEVLKGSLYLIRFILYSLVFLITYNLISSQVLKIKDLINFLIISGVILGIIGIAQILILPNLENPDFLLTDFGFDPHQGRLVSSFLDPNFAGTYLILTLGLVFYLLTQKQNKLLLTLAPFLLILIILTYSRTAYLFLGIFALIITFFWKNVLWKRKNLILVGILIGLLVTDLFFPRFYQRILGGVKIDESAATRLQSWQKGLKVTQQYPLLGVGFNNIRVSLSNLNLADVKSPDGGHGGAGFDSGFLFILATTGIIGLGIYLIFWANVFLSLSQKRDALNFILIALLAGLMISGQFINSLFYPPIMLWYFSLLGGSLETTGAGK